MQRFLTALRRLVERPVALGGQEKQPPADRDARDYPDADYDDRDPQAFGLEDDDD